jgi:hypothetical protein
MKKFFVLALLVVFSSAIMNQNALAECVSIGNGTYSSTAMGGGQFGSEAACKQAEAASKKRQGIAQKKKLQYQ